MSLKSDESNGILREDLRTFATLSQWIIFKIRHISDKSSREIKTHISCSVAFFRNLYRLGDNVGKCGGAGEATDGNIVRRVRIAC